MSPFNLEAGGSGFVIFYVDIKHIIKGTYNFENFLNLSSSRPYRNAVPPLSELFPIEDLQWSLLASNPCPVTPIRFPRVSMSQGLAIMVIFGFRLSAANR